MKFILMSLLSSVALSTTPPRKQVPESTRRLSNSTRRLFLKALGNYARYKAMQAPTPTIKQPATSTPTTEQQLESCKAELVTHCCDQYEAFLKNDATDRAWINKETSPRTTVLKSDFTQTATDCKCDFNNEQNRYQCYNKKCPKKTQIHWEGCFADKECSSTHKCLGEKETESGDVRSGYCGHKFFDEGY